MQIGFLGLLTLAAIAWGFARVLVAPRWVVRAIPLVLFGVMLASQLLLPPDAPMRESVGGALRTLALLGMLAVPVFAYFRVLDRLRKSNARPDGHPKGFVLIEDDAALAAEARDAAERARGEVVDWAPVSTFSIAFRPEGREVLASAQVVVTLGLALVRHLTLAPNADTGLAQSLLVEVEAEARRRRASRLATDA